MSRLFRRIDELILILISVIAAGITLAHFFHLIEAPWLTEHYPLFTLLLLSLLGLHLIVSHYSEEELHTSITNLIQQVSHPQSGIQCRIFDDSAEMESYLGKRMIEARKNICDLTWKARISEGFSAKDRQVAHEYMDKCIAEASAHIPYREIFVFSDSRRIDKLERRLSEGKSGYSCRYFREDSLIPRLQFVLIDDEEAFFFATSANSPLVSFKSKELCLVLKSYFEAAWSQAKPIKDGPRIIQTEVAYIQKLRDTPAPRRKDIHK
jgi:hypothetical protein